MYVIGPTGASEFYFGKYQGEHGAIEGVFKCTESVTGS